VILFEKNNVWILLVQVIATSDFNGTKQDLVYQFLLQQFSPVPKNLDKILMNLDTS